MTKKVGYICQAYSYPSLKYRKDSFKNCVDDAET